MDYFHIWDRASIPGHARNIFCVHISSYGFQHSHSSRPGFITQLKNSLLLEVMFTIYLTPNRESSRTSNRRENVYIFLTPLCASYNYSRNAKRVLQKPVRETHSPIERLGRDHSMVSSPEPLGSICNMATYLRRTEHVCSKLDLSNIIRLLELGFELQQFLNLLVNTWFYSWSKNYRMWHDSSREKSFTGLVG